MSPYITQSLIQTRIDDFRRTAGLSHGAVAERPARRRRLRVWPSRRRACGDVAALAAR